MKNPTHIETGLVSAETVMRKLNYTSRVSFWDAVKRLGIPRYKLGARKTLFDLNEVEDWLKQRRIGGGAK